MPRRVPDSAEQSIACFFKIFYFSGLTFQRKELLYLNTRAACQKKQKKDKIFLTG